MARINLGDFGNVTARPAPAQRVDPESFGGGVGRTLTQAGNVGMDMALREQAVADAEAKQQQREALAEAKAQAREAARVKALTAQATVSNGLADLQDEIGRGLEDGTITKDKAVEVFATRSQKLVDDGIKDVDAEHQELVRATVLGDIGRGRAGVIKAVRQRDQADIKAGGLTYFEEMQRLAARGPKEADQAIANVREFWTATAGSAGESAAQAQTRIQQFAERVRYTQASALVNADPGAAMKALKDPNYLPELDPQQRTSLLQTADVRVTQAANRAEIAARANERRMEREWTAVQTVLDAGKALDPAYADQVLKRFKGTAYEGALRQLMAEGPANAAFAGQPLPTQQRLLEELQGKMNREGATPELVKAYKKAEAANKAALADIKADPYMAAAERGVLKDLSQLQLGDLQALPQQLVRRAQDAAQVSQWVGQEVSLFRPAEAQKVGEVLAALPPKDRAGAIAGLGKVMTPGQMRAFAAQMGDKGDAGLKYALLYSGKMTTPATNMWGTPLGPGRRVSELIFEGQQAKKDGTSTKGDKSPELKSSQWGSHIATELQGLYPSQKLSDEIKEAATLIAHGLAAEASGQLSKDDLDRAVRLAIGGSVVEWNGRRIPIPAGMDEDALEKRMRTVTPDEIVRPAALGRASGMVEPGNIDLGKRPTVKNADGSISTVRSMSVNIDGKEVLLPTISDDGKQLSDQQAIDAFRRTGKHLGKFESPQSATAYAEALHEQQAGAYVVRAGGATISVAELVKKLPGLPLMPLRPGVYTPLVGGRPVLNTNGDPIAIELQ